MAPELFERSEKLHIVHKRRRRRGGRHGCRSLLITCHPPIAIHTGAIRFRTPLSAGGDARDMMRTSGRSEAWYRVRFGSGRSLVRIQSPRPLVPIVRLVPDLPTAAAASPSPLGL